jgi:hypothetical protein
VNNKRLTNADGIMSAEGLLDNPALYNKGVEVRKLQLGLEYIEIVKLYPVKIRSVVFHLRRMCKEELTKFQLMDECLNAKTLEELEQIIKSANDYDKFDRGEGGVKYVFDALKSKKEKDALEKKKREEGKRKAYEERMMRKAKREGKNLDHYLNVGLEAPTLDEIEALKKMSKTEAFAIWKEKHAQHCYAFHFNTGGCERERTCAFLHADPNISNETFVAYG